MRYLPGMPEVEGSICNAAYNRAGCRTPMHWDHGPNAGLSTADPARLYLPVDDDPGRPTVAAQETDPTSTLNLVRRLITLRRATPALGSRASTRLLHESYPLAYVRAGTHLVVVNPRRDPATIAAAEVLDARPLLESGTRISGDSLTAEGFGFGIFELVRRS